MVHTAFKREVFVTDKLKGFFLKLVDCVLSSFPQDEMFQL